MKKNITKIIALASLVFMLGGCGNNKTADSTDKSSSSSVTVSSTKSDDTSTRKFTDSAGREVEIPATLNKVAPSGAMAQIVLYTFEPETLVGLSSEFSDDAKEFVDAKYYNLPVFGQFYGKKSNLNIEALNAAEPDIVIDIGEAKDTIKDDMDQLQDQLGIPVVFIEATLDTMSDAYTQLGELYNKPDAAKKLSEYSKKVLDQAETNTKKISDDDKKSIYIAAGDTGLNTNAEGSFHAEILDVVGAKNVVTGVEAASQGYGTEVSMEQLMNWQPEYILANSKAVYDLITTDSVWAELDAVKNGKVYQVPTKPYNFLGTPPSVNRLIGISWIGNLLYPDVYTGDIKEEVTSFYELFYHVTLTDDQLNEVLENSLAK